MFDNHTTINLLIDYETHEIIDANKAAVNFYGWPKKELLSMKISDVNTLSTAQIKEVMDKIRIEDIKHVEFKHRLADGSIRDVESYTSMIEFDGRKVFNSIIYDVTDKKVFKNKLKESEARLQTLINSTPDIICFKDGKGRWLIANDADLELFALKNVNYFEKTDAELSIFTNPIYKNSFNTCIDSDELAWEKGDIFRGEEAIPTVNGETKVYDIIKVPVFNDDGSRNGLVVLGRDITDMKVVEKELAKLSLAIEQSPTMVLITDIEGNIEYFNPKFTEVTGYTLKDVKGKNPNILKSGEHTQEFYEVMWNTILDDKEWSGELHNKKKNGELYWESAKISALKDSSGKMINFVAVKQDITESREQAKRLRKSEYILKETQQMAGIGGWEYKVSNERMIWTDKVFKIYGIPVGTKLTLEENMLFYPEEDRVKITEAFRKCIAEGTPFQLDLKFNNKQNEQLWVKTSGKPVYADGKIYKVVGNIQDITSSKNMQLQLLKLSRAAEQSAESIVITDLEGNIEFVNTKFTEITGYSFNEVFKQNPRILKSGNQSAEFYVNMWNTISNGNSWNGEFQNMKKNGELYWESVSISPVKNEDGKVTHYIAVKEDITEAKKNREKLERSEERYRLITKSTGDVYYQLDYETMTYSYIHPNIEQLTGYTPNDFKLKSIIQEIQMNGKPCKLAEIEFERKKMGTKVFTLDYLIKTKSGEKKWIFDRSYPIYNKDNKQIGSAGVLSDLSEKKKLLDEVIEAKQKAENADKMKSIFLAQMSHEIRTPINAIVGMTSLLKSDFEENADEDQKQSFEIIDRAGERIIRTVDLLINLSEIQAGTYEIDNSQFDIYSDILISLVHEYRKLAESKNIKFSLKNLASDSHLVADSYTVNQIFTQLIDNAIKYTESGQISITITQNENSKIEVEIKDTGIGMESKYMMDLFKPFSQEQMGYSRKYEGNGIGLSLVKKYCELNNASLEVDSVKGAGSTFRIIFS